MSMTAFAELRAELGDLLVQLRGYGLMEPLRRDLDQCAAELMSECVVVVTGEFSRGKSSMLNALVGRPGLFPVGIDVTTAVVTELRWGERETAEVWLGDTSRPVAMRAVAEFIAESDNPANIKDVRLVRLTSPLEFVRHGMVLVDTPGIGSLNIEHATAAYAALGTADAVVFVGAADERMSTTELSYLAKAMTRCPLVITVLTKTDTLFDPGPELEVAVARERIAKESGRDPDEVLVVGVSARRMLQAMQSGDEAKIRRSGFVHLKQLLTATIVATWGKTLLNRVLDIVGEILEKAAAPVGNQLLALTSDGALERVCAELATTRARAAELSSQSASWRRDLADGFGRETAKIRENLVEACASIKDDFVSAAYSDRAASEPEAVVRDCTVRLVDAVEEAGSQLREACESLGNRAARQTRLPFSAAVGLPQVEVDLRLPAALTERWRSAGLVESAFKSAAVGTGVGTAIGGAIGTLILPGIGTAVGLVGGLTGTLIGLFSGIYDHYVTSGHKKREEMTTLLVNLVQPKIERVIDRVLADAEDAIEVARSSLLAKLENEIETARQSAATSITLLEENRSSTEEQRALRRGQLATQQAEIDRFWRQFHEIRSRAQALG